jgi:hypothetical protein
MVDWAKIRRLGEELQAKGMAVAAATLHGGTPYDSVIAYIADEYRFVEDSATRYALLLGIDRAQIIKAMYRLSTASPKHWSQVTLEDVQNYFKNERMG